MSNLVAKLSRGTGLLSDIILIVKDISIIGGGGGGGGGVNLILPYFFICLILLHSGSQKGKIGMR